MIDVSTLSSGDTVRIIREGSLSTWFHYFRAGAEPTYVRTTSAGHIVLRATDQDQWSDGAGYGVGEENSVPVEDCEPVGVLLDDEWRPPVGTEVVIIGGTGSYHSFPEGSTVKIDTIGGAGSGTHVRAVDSSGYTQWLRPGEYALPEGVAWRLDPEAGIDPLERFKRKTVRAALNSRRAFGLNHGDMIDFLTNDLGLGAYLPPVKVDVVVRVEVPAGSTESVREAATALVRSGEGEVQGRPSILAE